MSEDSLCRTVREELGEWAREALPPGRVAEIQAHLEACPECATAAERERALHALLQAVPSAEPGPEFDAALAARLAAEPLPGERARPHRLRLVAGGAAALAAAAAALLLLRAGPVEPEGPTPDPPPLAELALVEDLDLYQNLELIELLDVLPDLEAIEALPEEEPT